MVAYSFKGQFEDPIRAGTKPQTMRNDRKRHARVGEEIQLYYGMRTKHCRLIGRATCSAVTPVRIDFKRCTVRIEGQPLIKGQMALDYFAVRDGFKDWAALRAFWVKEHRENTKKGEPTRPLLAWSGVLIEWKDFKGSL